MKYENTYTEADNSRNAGSVISRETRTITFDVFIEANQIHSNEDTEYVIKVNGTVVKRLNRFQAERLIGVTRP